MASVIREFTVNASVEEVWKVVGNFANGPLKFAPSVFVGCQLKTPDTRVLAFADGNSATEQLISCDEKTHRVAWRWVDENIIHDNTVMQVSAADAKKSRVIWSHDVLPNEAAKWLAPTMDMLIPLFQQTFVNQEEEL
jgi:hypothetical protein